MTNCADTFLEEDHGLLIDGAWGPARSRSVLPVFNPATGEQIATISAGGEADVDAAVAAARHALTSPAWARMTPADRGRLLWRIADAIEQHGEELARLEFLDNGKSPGIVLRADVPAAAEVFRYYAGWCTKIYGETAVLSRTGEHHAYTSREPLGVAALIIPWNFPLLMAAWKLAPALAAGCTCILKPAEETSLTALRLGQLLTGVGTPPGVVNIVTGEGRVAGAALAAHPEVDKVAFTGSTEVGRLIVQAAAGNLKKVSLELGGKSPTIIMPDADLQAAIPAAAMSIFFNAGQICAAGSRLLAHRSVFDRCIEGISRIAANMKVGPGDDAQNQMGPLISAKQLSRVERMVGEGVNEGARIAVGGKRARPTGYFFEPTVLVQTTPSMEVVREEIFGPVLVANSFEDPEEAITRANETVYGLSAAFWTRDLSTAHRMAQRIKSGSVMVNNGGPNDPALPFGGYKQSGWGREFGREGLELYLQTKTVTVAL